jgi:hypothetical protein
MNSSIQVLFMSVPSFPVVGGWWPGAGYLTAFAAREPTKTGRSVDSFLEHPPIGCDLLIICQKK